MVELSVVIPTYNRFPILRHCLAVLEEQTLNRTRYEIIVVDDGSSDGTAAALAARPELEVICRRRSRGPAAARNAGIHAASGKYVLFLGDDIIARPQLLEQHLAVHAQERGEHVAVLGYCRWDGAPGITPLMRYMAEGWLFPQFHYQRIDDPDDVRFDHFSTCNLSMSRQFLLRHGGFDEEFRHAYGEDTELGYRLERCGMRLVYRKQLVADYCHPTSYRAVRRRTRVAGEVMVLMSKKHPELADLSFLGAFGLKERAANWMKRSMIESVLDPLLDHADQRRWDHPVLARVYDWTLRKHQLWGLMDAAGREGAIPQRS